MSFTALVLSLFMLGACGGRPAHEAAPARAAPVASSNALACPRAGPGKLRGHVASPLLDEISGLVASRTHRGVLWVHNDSGDSARLFALRDSGELLLELRLLGAGAVDIEDVAIGPGPESGKQYLYLADIGDNLARRKRVFIYRVEEPAELAQGVVLTARAHQLEVTYQDGPRDAESLLSDPATGDLYIVSKASFFSSDDAAVGVYRVEHASLAASKVSARRMAAVAMGPATAGDIAPDGTLIALRNYETLRFWRRTPGQPITDALGHPACPMPLADGDEQGEALGFAADGKGYYTISEGKRQPVYFHELAR
jgi:hypothetical protein